MNQDSGDDREMQLWHPIEDIRSLAEHVCRAVDGAPRETGGPRGLAARRAPEPKLTLAENAKGFVVRVELPDVLKKDLHVNVAESTVTIFARWGKERKTKAKDGTQRIESAEQLYSRTLQLPATVMADQAKASFRDRVLKIFLPRAGPSQVRRIDVK
jgi:HSP20 family protein